MKKARVRAKVYGQSITSAIVVDKDQAPRVSSALKNVLQATTPRDTGKAVNSWEIIKMSPVNYRVNSGIVYMQYLNQGTSKQALPRFVERAVDSVRAATRGSQGKLIHASKNGKPGWKYGDNGFVYTYNPNTRGSETIAKKKARRSGSNISDAISSIAAAAVVLAAVRETLKKREDQRKEKENGV
jgi:hypothetical protein